MDKKAKQQVSLLQTFFMRGILFCAPIGLIWFLVSIVYSYIDNWFGGISAWLVRFLLPDSILIGPFAGGHIPGLSLLLFIFFLLAIGAIASKPLGKKGLRLIDYFFLFIPIIKSIYSGTRKITDTVGDTSQSPFQRAVWVNWPGPNSKTLGFVTNTIHDSLTQKPFLTIFVPTMPNPTTGFVVVVPEDETIEVNLSIEDALKMCISVGVLAPKEMQLTTLHM
jgi:uncharacterized membrane protein